MAADYPVIDVTVCRDARVSIQEALKRMAPAIKRAPGEIPALTDGVVEDVRAARARARDLMQRADEDGNERLMLVAQRYDEMIINAQVRLLELGVKAASNEQASIDRQMHIQAYKETKAGPALPQAQESTSAELDKLKMRQALIAAAQSSAPRDAEFTTDSPE